MKDVSDAVSGFLLLVVVFSLVVVFFLFSRSTVLPFIDAWIIDAVALEKIPIDVKPLPAYEPCWSGYQCQSKFCIRRGTVDDTTLFSSGICSPEVREKGCTTEITLGLTTRSMCIE